MPALARSRGSSGRNPAHLPAAVEEPRGLSRPSVHECYIDFIHLYSPASPISCCEKTGALAGSCQAQAGIRI